MYKLTLEARSFLIRSIKTIPISNIRPGTHDLWVSVFSLYRMELAVFRKLSIGRARISRAAGAICDKLESRRLLASALTGTVIGTPGSYNGHPTMIGNAFDGNFTTYFDGPTASGDWAGLDLGTTANITQVKYAPRAGFEGRTVGGTFQGSNSATFASGVVNLFIISKAPVAGSFTAQAVASTGSFRYVRYITPTSGWGDIAELEFDGTLTAAAPPALAVTASGTPGSYANQGNTFTNVFDGNLNSFFDAPTANGNYVQAAFSQQAILTQINYAPRAAFPSRMVGGIFEGSNDPTFATGVTTLYTIASTPVAGVLTSVPITTTTAFQYVRYVAPAGSYGNIAEMSFIGTLYTPPPPTLSVTASGTAGSWSNSGNTFAKAFDGDLTTYFDAPGANGNYVQAGFSSEANLTQINYAPRAAFPSRMVGGIFEASNDVNFIIGDVTLYTITATPAVGVMTSVPITTTSAYAYVRYLAPSGSYGNIAELSFAGTLTGVQPPAYQHPSVTTSSPANGATGVNPSGFISCALNLPNLAAGVNPGTMTDTTVFLYRTFDKTIIPTEVNTDAVGSVIVLQPQSPLAGNTSYTFCVTSGVTDITGTSFIPYQITFTTGQQTAPTNPNIAFQKVALPTATGQLFTGVTLGPDGDLYASTLMGGIFQFSVNADGTLGTPVNLTAADPARLITGVAFDPSSTATNMTLWVSSSSVLETNAPDWSGIISTITITGNTAKPYTDYVTGLPRSNSNHTNDQPVFGPDGALYWCQGSNSSMGGADSVWGYRPEHLLNAAILRLNVQAVEQYVATNHAPLNVQTDSLPAGQTAYNPYAAGAPLTLYATGVRNAYDLIWDTNGHLYAPTNGAAAGGNLPGSPAGVTPVVPAENGIGQAEDDYLYDIVPGGYYGHPDPSRGQYVFGGGNPVNPPANFAVQGAYPLGTNPDPNYKGYAYDFGVHYSPDGAIEYTGSAFGGALNGDLLITRYSGGKDVLALTTGASGQITSGITGISGFTGFTDPVDITENPANGDLYVVDLGNETITLLTPISSGAAISVSAPTMYFNNAVSSSASTQQAFTITNTGTQPLAIPATGLSVIGSDAPLFIVASSPALPAVIPAGGSVTIGIVYLAGTSSLGLHAAQLQIASNATGNPFVLVNLRGLTTAGTAANQEPSLQAVLNLLQIPDNVGTADPSQTYFTTPPQTPNDEVVLQELEKASAGPVTITPLAAFDPAITPAAGLGYYIAGTPTSRSQLFTVASTAVQTMFPTVAGSTSFDPGAAEFGLFGSFEEYTNLATGTPRFSYSEDSLNTFDSVNPRKIRFYPMKNADGSLVANSYVFAIDDSAAAPYSFNELIGVISNVMPAPAGPKIGTENVIGTDTESAPSATSLVFNTIAASNGSAPVITHSTADLRVLNTGSQPLVIGSINVSNAAFSVQTAITYPLTIAAGSSTDLILNYNPTADTGLNAVDSAKLTLNSNDPISPALSVQLTGIWQSAAGAAAQPTLQQIAGAFGYTTAISNTGQSLNQSGQATAVGQEVLSAYWTRVDANQPIAVQQLASFNSQTAAPTLYWYGQASNSSFNTIVSAAADNTQSLLPLTNDLTGAPAFGTFNPSGSFGLNVDKSIYSDNTLNTLAAAPDQGHRVRFYPVYNAANQLVPYTWLMAMDYTASAGTYVANVYLLSNMKPAAPATPTGVKAVGSTTGVTVSWTAVSSPLVSGYQVWRSTSATGTFSLISTTPVAATSFLDTPAVGTTYYYEVAAVDPYGSSSPLSAVVSAARTK